MEKLKNLYVQPTGMNWGEGNVGGREGAGQRGIKRRKYWDNCNSIINKIYFKEIKNKNIGGTLIQRNNAQQKERSDFYLLPQHG